MNSTPPGNLKQELWIKAKRSIGRVTLLWVRGWRQEILISLGEENSLATMGPEQGSGARVFTAKEAGLDVTKMTSLSPETPVAAVKLHGSQTRPKSSSGRNIL